MRIAYTVAPGRGDTDLLLAGLAEELVAQGIRTVGTVQINTACDDEGPCDMDVRVLPDGPIIRISQSLGKGARGCRLDPGALETAIAHCEARLGDADLLIVNKFGKQEASGRGFRNLIAEALARDMPVLVGLNRLNHDAFHAFTGDAAVELSPTREALRTWLDDVTGKGQSAA